MKNQDIWDAYEGLSELSSNNIKFKAVTSFLLAKNKRTLEPIYKALLETREKLFKKYGEQVEEGWRIPKENTDLFKNEFNILMDTETYINIDKISIENFEDEKIEINLMEKLTPLIEYKK